MTIIKERDCLRLWLWLVVASGKTVVKFETKTQAHIKYHVHFWW